MASPTSVLAVLRGVDHTELGVTVGGAPAPDLGVALSRGRHPKSYAYTDPNEDVVAAARWGASTALVVADGHSGWVASHTAVEAVLDLLAARAGDGRPAWDRREAVHALHEVNERIREARRAVAGTSRRSRTTVATAVVEEDTDAGGRWLVHAAVGDSAVVVVRDGRAHLVTRDRHHFLGDPLSAPMVAGALDHGRTALEPDDAVVVVTDGYTGFAAVGELPDVLGGAVRAGDAEAAARAVVAHAGDRGAGDNVGVAVLLPDARPAG